MAARFTPQQIAEKLSAMLPADACIEIVPGSDGSGTTTRVVRARYIYNAVHVAVTDCGIDIKTRRGRQGYPVAGATWSDWYTLPGGFTMREIADHMSYQLFY